MGQTSVPFPEVGSYADRNGGDAPGRTIGAGLDAPLSGDGLARVSLGVRASKTASNALLDWKPA